MRRIGHEAAAGAGVTLCARLHQIRARHRRFRVGGGKDVVRVVTIPATRGLHVPERGDLGMECVPVGAVSFPVTASARGGRFHLESSLADIADLVRGVAADAHRSLRVARLQSCSVDPGEVLVFDPLVARAAGVRNIGAVDAALWIRGRENVVRAVAAGARRGYQQSVFGKREAVDGVHVLRVHVGQTMLLGEFLVAMAGPAGSRQIQRIDRRFRVFHVHDGVDVAVTGCAGLLAGARVHARRQRRSGVGVTGAATDFGHLIRVRKALDIGVTAGAAHSRVDAGMKRSALLVVALLAQRIGRGRRREGPGVRDENQRNKSRRDAFHGFLPLAGSGAGAGGSVLGACPGTRSRSVKIFGFFSPTAASV